MDRRASSSHLTREETSLPTSKPSPTCPTSSMGKIGFDFKYGITRSLVFDLTYNTDFAEVEVDEEQVNLTRFDLFFPEKRDFFLEGQGIFSFGIEGGRRTLPPPKVPVIFFSRRIGLQDDLSVPIVAGGRFDR